MSVRLGEWGSTAETEGHLVCEGITQQPGPFYNGNFSSSIWGNPPTPPLWRDMPSINASCSSSGGQQFGFPSSDKQTTESVMSRELSDKQEEIVSKWLEDFSFGQDARPQESLNSPFSFGFPSTPPQTQTSSSSSVCDQGTLNGSSYSQSHCAGESAAVNMHRNPINEGTKMFGKGSSQLFTHATADSLKELSNKWGSMLQSQDGLHGSFDSQLPLHRSFTFDSSVEGLAFSKGVMPVEHSYGNPSKESVKPTQHSNSFAEANNHAASFHKQQSSHSFIGTPVASPDLVHCNRTSPLFSQKRNSGTFVFGSCPASGTSGNVGVSLQKDASAAGSMPRSSVTKPKVKKQNNFVKRRGPTAPVSKAFQPAPSESSTCPSHFSNPGLNFTTSMSDADTYSDGKPASSLQNPRTSVQKVSSSFGANTAGVQSPLFFSGAASSKDTESVASLSEGYSSQQGSESQHAQTFGEQFDAWHPFLQREEKSFKTCGLDGEFVGVVLSKETPYSNNSGKKQGKWEASEKATFFNEELPKPSTEANIASEGSKLAEFNMNSPGKLSVEDLRERAAKWGRSGEEIRRQKENQEPNFTFGSQKASRPFVFGASRTSSSTKNATLSTDNINKNERSLKGSKDSKVLEHLVAKLGEKMADLGKSHDAQSNAVCTGRTVAEGIKECSASECSSGKFCERLAKEEIFDQELKNKTTNRSQDAFNIVEKNIALNHSIDELREQIAKLGSFDDQLDRRNDKTDKGMFSSEGARYSNSMEHAAKDLSEQSAKLGNFGEKREEDTRAKVKCSASEDQHKGSHGSSAVEHAVEELREQIAKLGRAARDNKQDKCSASILQQSEVFEQSVEELCERMVILGKAAEKGNNHNLDQESKSNHDQKKVQDAFVFSAYNATAQKDDSVGFHWSKAFAGSNRTGFISTTQLNPFANGTHFNLFPSNAFAGPQFSSSFSTVNLFTARQPTPCAEAHNGAKFSVGPQYSPQYSSPLSMVNPFTVGQPPPSAGSRNGSKFSATVNPFTAGPPRPCAQAHNGAKFSATLNPFPAGQPPSCAEAQNGVKFSFGSQYSDSFSMVNPFTAGQSPPFAEAYNGAKFAASDMPSASNDTGEGSSHQGFEFRGTKEPISGMTMQRKNGRSCPKIRSREKGNLTRSRRNSVLHGKILDTSSAHNAGSPMDFSPCADKFAPSSPNNGSDEPQQTPVQKSPEQKPIEAESMNVEELRMATSNLTIGNEDGSNNGDQKESRSFEHSSAEANPFVLCQRKGRWKRAPRNHTGACGINRKQAKEHVQMSSLGEEFHFSSFSPLADPHRVGAREKSLRKTTSNQGSAFFANEKGEKSAQKASFKKTSQPFRFSKLDKEQKATNIAREVPLSPNAMRRAAAEEWRIRGNQAYAKGDYEKAEDCYSRGAGSVSPEDTSQSCMRAIMLCYSNRAATRMAVGRMKEALADCQQAMMLDSSFLRVRLRAASCYLALGESSAAAALFADCWKCANEIDSFDMKILDEATNGVKKSQQFDNLLERVSKLCQGETSTDASAALHPLNEALLISPFSEALLELKAKALFSLRRFEDVLQLCEQTLPAAEENHIVKQDHEQCVHKDFISLNLWRWRMCGKSLFHLGKLEESSSLLTKYEEATCCSLFNQAANTESVAAILINIRDLLHHKAAGNEAFQAGRHADAVEHYTAALACSGESRPYNAVCFCNRAAASQALGHIADAIADCSRAIVLDSHYAKAISRRATLHEIIKDYGQSCNDLGRLIALLEGQEAHSRSPKLTRGVSKHAQDLRQARDRLEKATKELRKGCAVDHYLILGLDVSCSSNDIKKAYRKAALKHHPDKAGQFLVRGENGDDGSLWKEVGEEVRRDAERLFKLIGESYAILSDPTKRAQYDVDNHTSSARNYPGYGSTGDYCSPCEKSSRRQRERRDGWSGYSPRYQRWQNGPDAAQPDTYSERNTRDSGSSKDCRNRGRTDFYWSEF